MASPVQLNEVEIAGQHRILAVENLLIAGWTGRDTAAVEQHIAELETIGIARPRTTPMFYQVGANLLTSAKEVEVVGFDSSGEVEFVLVSLQGELFVGVGSDHTDRKVEAYGVTVSKQMCPKPMGRTLWPLHEVKDHWDSLILRSWVTRNGERRLYQEGCVNRMHSPEELLRRYIAHSGPLPAGTVMFGGTMPVIGEMSGGDLFEIELEDPAKGRSLRHTYGICCLPYAD